MNVFLFLLLFVADLTAVCRSPPEGPPGPPGIPIEINSAIEATNTDTIAIGNALIPFTSPIAFPANGINVGEMILVESVPASGNFDTVILPLETADTLYQVNYGVGVAGNAEDAEFQLVLNGTPLPYTTIGIFSNGNFFLDGTSVVSNPANTQGTLSLLSLSAPTTIAPMGPNSVSAYLTVVKLNNNEP